MPAQSGYRGHIGMLYGCAPSAASITMLRLAAQAQDEPFMNHGGAITGRW